MVLINSTDSDLITATRTKASLELKKESISRDLLSSEGGKNLLEFKDDIC